jgi:hypothetical protein
MRELRRFLFVWYAPASRFMRHAATILAVQAYAVNHGMLPKSSHRRLPLIDASAKEA